jgi:two-component system, chemotaxis family, response regulator PixG
MTSQNNVKFKDLIAELNNIKAHAFSGNLIIQIAENPVWMLCFYSGRLGSISGGVDSLDRWQRNLALSSLNAPLDRLIKSNNDREVFLNSNKIAHELVAKEILFDIIQFSHHQGDRLSYQIISISGNNFQQNSSLPLLEIQPILIATIQVWQEWEQHGLASYAPSLFPIIQKPEQISNFDDNKDLQYLISSVDSHKSIRSLAIHHQKKVIDVVESFLPLLKSGIITLSSSKEPSRIQDVQPETKISPEVDLNQARISSSNHITSASASAAIRIEDRSTTNVSPLIACIDDSISVYKNLEKIFIEHGYRSFGIQDPLKIIPSLIKNKPDLIFLDLVMPVTNGYEVCEQIRKTPSLSSVPIIILSGNDGLIDRVRTKFVGANGFLSKPIDPKSVLKMIDKYLGKQESNVANSHGDKSEKISIDAEQIIQHHQLSVLNHINKRVLVVDDDLSIREVVSMCLHKLKGWDVLTAASGQEGLNGVRINNPDVIVLDVMMPEMDGLAFLRYLRANDTTKLIPVVLLTANRYLPDRHLLTELGVVDVVSKPFLPINLVRQIDRALECKLCPS